LAGKRGVAAPSWITAEGFIDIGKFPIDGVLRQALDQDAEVFRGACSVLESMVCHGRIEAGVFLLGLLSWHRDDLERLSRVVRALREFHTREALDALTAELRRVPSTNATRSYLNAVFEALTRFPDDMVRGVFVELSVDKAFSIRWRRKFEGALRDMDGYSASDDDCW
jgi:hypothetical protein